MDKIMPKLKKKKKNRKISILSKKYEDVIMMRTNEERHAVCFGILKWLLSLWKGLKTETKEVGEINRN